MPNPLPPTPAAPRATRRAAWRRSSPRRALLAVLLVSALPLRAQEPVTADSAAIKQADVGGQWFRSVCVECHANNLSDTDFRAKWGGRSAYELFDRMRNSMPDSDPGSLTPETYAALTAYLLRLNGMPIGTTMITTDSSTLAGIKLAFPSTLR